MRIERCYPARRASGHHRPGRRRPAGSELEELPSPPPLLLPVAAAEAPEGVVLGQPMAMPTDHCERLTLSSCFRVPPCQRPASAGNLPMGVALPESGGPDEHGGYDAELIERNDRFARFLPYSRWPSRRARNPLGLAPTAVGELCPSSPASKMPNRMPTSPITMMVSFGEKRMMEAGGGGAHLPRDR